MKIRNSHFLVADITGANINVLIEVGYAMGAGKPVVLIQQRRDESKMPFDIQHFIWLPYEVTTDTAGKRVVTLLERELRRVKDVIVEKARLNEASPFSG